MFYQKSSYFKHIFKSWCFIWENIALGGCDNAERKENRKRDFYSPFSCICPHDSKFLI